LARGDLGPVPGRQSVVGIGPSVTHGLEDHTSESTVSAQWGEGNATTSVTSLSALGKPVTSQVNRFVSKYRRGPPGWSAPGSSRGSGRRSGGPGRVLGVLSSVGDRPSRDRAEIAALPRQPSGQLLEDVRAAGALSQRLHRKWTPRLIVLVRTAPSSPGRRTAARPNTDHPRTEVSRLGPPTTYTAHFATP